jgi:polyisoprenyl-phosphate glycosyltransferase
MNELLSIVVPVFNEEEVIGLFIEELNKSVLSTRNNTEVIFVNDGSTDSSEKIILREREKDSRIKYLKLSRNFGHQNAVMAGLHASTGQLICIIDADLQDDPAHILEMEKYINDECFIVYGRRLSRLGETYFKRISAIVFYRLINYLSMIDIPKDTGDFRLVKSDVVDVILSMNENDPFLRGLFAFTGFPSKPYDYIRNPRKAGVTKYPFRKMLKFAITAILSFSEKPLRMALNTALLGLVLSLIGSIVVFLFWIFESPVAGWASTITVIVFLSSLNLAVTSIVGRYVYTIWRSSQGRPTFIIEKSLT